MADTKMVKSAGEHWVCSVLSRYRWAVALTRDGLERTDILGAHTDSGTLIEVQVKTASAMPHLNWLVGLKGLVEARSEREWYVFVGLDASPTGAPRAFVVPRDHVAAATWIRHQDWLTDPTVAAG